MNVVVYGFDAIFKAKNDTAGIFEFFAVTRVMTFGNACIQGHWASQNGNVTLEVAFRIC